MLARAMQDTKDKFEKVATDRRDIIVNIFTAWCE
jgi:hypothetical protein